MHLHNLKRAHWLHCVLVQLNHYHTLKRRLRTSLKRCWITLFVSTRFSLVLTNSITWKAAYKGVHNGLAYHHLRKQLQALRSSSQIKGLKEGTVAYPNISTDICRFFGWCTWLGPFFWSWELEINRGTATSQMAATLAFAPTSSSRHYWKSDHNLLAATNSPFHTICSWVYKEWIAICSLGSTLFVTALQHTHFKPDFTRSARLPNMSQ